MISSICEVITYIVLTYLIPSGQVKHLRENPFFDQEVQPSGKVAPRNRGFIAEAQRTPSNPFPRQTFHAKKNK